MRHGAEHRAAQHLVVLQEVVYHHGANTAQHHLDLFVAEMLWPGLMNSDLADIAAQHLILAAANALSQSDVHDKLEANVNIL